MSMQVIKIENGKKQLCIVAGTDEDRDWLKDLTAGEVEVVIIKESNVGILGTPVTGSILISQKKD
jgi:hypothetical protein